MQTTVGGKKSFTCKVPEQELPEAKCFTSAVIVCPIWLQSKMLVGNKNPCCENSRSWSVPGQVAAALGAINWVVIATWPVASREICKPSLQVSEHWEKAGAKGQKTARHAAPKRRKQFVVNELE